jgi:hypothetical protein
VYSSEFPQSCPGYHRALVARPEDLRNHGPVLERAAGTGGQPLEWTPIYSENGAAVIQTSGPANNGAAGELAKMISDCKFTVYGASTEPPAGLLQLAVCDRAGRASTENKSPCSRFAVRRPRSWRGGRGSGDVPEARQHEASLKLACGESGGCPGVAAILERRLASAPKQVQVLKWPRSPLTCGDILPSQRLRFCGAEWDGNKTEACVPIRDDLNSPPRQSDRVWKNPRAKPARSAHRLRPRCGAVRKWHRYRGRSGAKRKSEAR